ncbi:hypothetical protein [Xanthomonas sacchari]|uniref:hypothetical protein n=1 Tax=Xanthomonas sacchari TaxID=56458 RepID=UPI00225E5F1A|nr:hypothetical protein [Xanthomonas sacchari]
MLDSMRAGPECVGLSAAVAGTMVWSSPAPRAPALPAPRKAVAAQGEAAFRDVLTTDSEAC